MPSVADTVRFRTSFTRLGVPMRNTIITETIAWLESEERPNVKPEHLSHLINFENSLQSLLNQKTIPETWFTMTANTYASFPFYDKFLRRLR